MSTKNICDAGDVLVRPISSPDFDVQALCGAAQIEKFEEAGEPGESYVEWARRLV